MNAETINQEFDKNAAKFVDGVVVAKGAITGVLNQACGGDDNRHLVLKALTGSTSSRSMSEAQWFALLQFVQPYKPEGGRWQSQRGDDLRVECGILLTAQADQEGQLKMFEEASHENR